MAEFRQQDILVPLFSFGLQANELGQHAGEKPNSQVDETPLCYLGHEGPVPKGLLSRTHVIKVTTHPGHCVRE